MNDGELNLKEIGDKVFAEATTFNANKRAFIKDTMPPLRELTFLYSSKIVLDEYSMKIWKFNEFKSYLNKEVEDEYTYQKKMNDMKNRLIDNNEWNEATDEWIKISIDDSKLRVLDLVKKLSHLKEIKNQGTTYDIEKIKEILITDYLIFNSGGFVKCIYHEDKTPSMKYYKKTNSCFCFSCNKSSDIIDIFQQLNNCNFREAIYQLSKAIK